MDNNRESLSYKIILAKRQISSVRECGETVAQFLSDLDRALMARSINEYHEDIGPVLWWKFPITEPPYVGSPNDTDWPGYHTHFTRLILPRESKP